jgi:hypothetical protein
MLWRCSALYSFVLHCYDSDILNKTRIRFFKLQLCIFFSFPIFFPFLLFILFSSSIKLLLPWLLKNVLFVWWLIPTQLCTCLLNLVLLFTYSFNIEEYIYLRLDTTNFTIVSNCKVNLGVATCFGRSCSHLQASFKKRTSTLLWQ